MYMLWVPANSFSAPDFCQRIVYFSKYMWIVAHEKSADSDLAIKPYKVLNSIFINLYGITMGSL